MISDPWMHALAILENSKQTRHLGWFVVSISPVTIHLTMLVTLLRIMIIS